MLDDAERTRVKGVVNAKVPEAVKVTYTRDGEVASNMLMGIDAAAEDRINDVHNHHDHHHEHGHHHEHAHDHFDSFVIKLGEVDSDKLKAALKDLLAEYNIFRAKGFAALPGKPMRQVLQAVGERLDTHFDRLWAADETRGTNLVFIGKDIDKETIEKALATAVA